jgi:hypothetical protein
MLQIVFCLEVVCIMNYITVVFQENMGNMLNGTYGFMFISLLSFLFKCMIFIHDKVHVYIVAI